MPPAKGTVFFNPSSGAKLPEAESQALQAACVDMGLELIRLTRGIDCAQTIRERMQRGVRLFVAAGGDGTVSNVVQPIVNSDATFAVIPVGTYNHFARDLGIPLDWREALDIAVKGETRQVDTARVNDRFFVNNLSLGLYPELVAMREERGRDYPRWRARIQAAIGTLKKYPHVTLTIETAHHQELVRTHVLMVSNNSYDLSRIGIEAGRTTLEGGRLSVYWLPKVSRWSLMKFMAHYLAGTVHHAAGFVSFQTSAMKVQSARPRLKVGVDGEVIALATPLAITIVPQSLLVKVAK